MSSPPLNPDPQPVWPFPNATGAGVRVAVIDSGVNPRHPHIERVSGGICIGEDASYLDVLGHGTAVMAAIQEKAPDAEYFAVRVFHTALRATADRLIQAIHWTIENQMDIVNLSLGTVNAAHTERFAEVCDHAVRSGTLLVAALEAGGRPCLPGSLPNVLGVSLDADCRRDRYRCEATPEGVLYFASGYPKPVPGVPLEHNLNGISFAVANMTGFAARAAQSLSSPRRPDQVKAALQREAAAL